MCNVSIASRRRPPHSYFRGVFFFGRFVAVPAIMLASMAHSSAFAAPDFFFFTPLPCNGAAGVVCESAPVVEAGLPSASKRGERSALRTALWAQLKMTRFGKTDTMRSPLAPFFSAFTCRPGLCLSISAFTKSKSSFPAHLEQYAMLTALIILGGMPSEE